MIECWRRLAVAAGAAMAMTASADAVVFPKVSDVAVVQEADDTYKITYKLNQAPAIVTVDIVTNALGGAGASIGGENLREVWGDVGRIIGLKHDFSTPYEGVIHWVPYRTAFKDIDLDFAANSVKAAVTAYPTNDPPDYVVVRLDMKESDGNAAKLPQKLARGSGVRFYPNVESLPGGLLENLEYRENKMVLRRVPAAGVEWMMGSATNAGSRQAAYEIPRLVMLTRDYYLGVFECTQKQRQYLNSDGSGRGAVNSHNGYKTLEEFNRTPMTGWSYNALRGESSDTTVLSQPTSSSQLGKLRSLTKIDFDLPTNAEWEYACRAGLDGPTGIANIDIDWDVSQVCDRMAWTKVNSTNVVDGVPTTGPVAHIVGLKEPNAWGFYDMLGNAWEMVVDLFQTGQPLFDGFGGRSDVGYAEPVVDPVVASQETAPTDAKSRIRRGGGVAEEWTAFRNAVNWNLKYSDGWCGARFRCPAAF